MSDDNASSRPSATSSGRQASTPGPTNLRRSATVDESFSRRPSRFDSPTAAAADPFDSNPRRRSSTFSEYSLGEAGGLFNPKPTGSRPVEDSSSNWASIPLAFALLPAVGGVFFKNGSAVVTDVMLLGLAAVFLHWSVTQPWNWYHAAQEIRVREEVQQSAIETDEDSEAEHRSNRGDSPEREVARPQGEAPEPGTPSKTTGRHVARSDALAELYLHEVSALLSCFLFPVIGAYLLHTIRSQLSRPSEGLVSNYNLTIFLLASELRPLSHLMTLVQSRTLHLQRLVSENPYKPDSDTATQLSTLAERLEALESRPASGSPSRRRNGTADESGGKQDAAIARDVRNVIQPELDALNRAVRRYEKKATLLSLQTESRFNSMDMRLNDALSLAAAAAKHSTSQPGLLQWVAESVLDMVMMPFRGLFTLFLFPFRTALGLVQGRKLAERRSRTSRGARPGTQYRSGSDRPPARVARR